MPVWEVAAVAADAVGAAFASCVLVVVTEGAGGGVVTLGDGAVAAAVEVASVGFERALELGSSLSRSARDDIAATRSSAHAPTTPNTMKRSFLRCSATPGSGYASDSSATACAD